jgi:hypothetical protein
VDILEVIDLTMRALHFYPDNNASFFKPFGTGLKIIAVIEFIATQALLSVDHEIA